MKPCEGVRCDSYEFRYEGSYKICKKCGKISYKDD